MNCATITVSDKTATPQSLLKLLQGGSITGYTVVPSTGIGGLLGSPTMFSGVQYVSVQASYANSGVTVYKGDENVKNDGTRQGKELAAGDTDVIQAFQYQVSLAEIYLTASANGAKINVEIHNS